MKLDDIFKKRLELAAAKEKARLDIAELERQLEAANTEAEAAALSGNEDEYIRLTDKASEISRRIYVKRKIIDAKEILDPRDVEAAWKDYADAYNKKFQTKYKAFEKQRQKLCKMYEEMINDQYELLQIRKKAGESMGVELHGLDSESVLAFDKLPGTRPHVLNGIGVPPARAYNCRCLEIPLFYDSGDIDAATLEKWRNIFILNV